MKRPVCRACSLTLGRFLLLGIFVLPLDFQAHPSDAPSEAVKAKGEEAASGSADVQSEPLDVLKAKAEKGACRCSTRPWRQVRYGQWGAQGFSRSH